MRYFKKAKRRISIITVLTLILSVSLFEFPANAEGFKEGEILPSSVTSEISEDEQILYSGTIDEYSMIKELKSKDNKQLLQNGYNQDQINSLKSLDFEEELDKRSKLSASELKGLGYNEESIRALKSLDESPTEDQLMAASSYLTMTVTALDTKHGHNNDLSWAVFNVYWSWSSCPVWLQNDIVAIGWSEGFYLTESYQSSYTNASVDYYSSDDNSFLTTKYYSSDIKPDLNKGASLTFDQGWDNGYGVTYWGRHGRMGIKLTKQANIPEMCVQVGYGHTKVTASPSVSFDVSGSGATASVGLDFSWGVKSEDSDYLYLKL